jgi:hypothetical protein
MSLPADVRATSVSQTSPTKWCEEHAIYDSETGAEVHFFGLWEPPDLTGASDTESVMRVDDVNVRMDKLAYQLYQDPTLHWFIAYYNDLDVPDAYVYRGMEIRYPSKDWVLANIVNKPRTQRRTTV